MHLAETRATERSTDPMKTRFWRPYRPTYSRLRRLSYVAGILPSVVVLGVYVFLLGTALVSALTDEGGGVSLTHVSQVLADPLFRQGLGYNLLIPLVSVALETAIGVGMAFWFLSIGRNTTFWRTIAIMPFALPEIVYLFTMKLLFREHGYLNSLLSGSFADSSLIGWLQPGGALIVATVIVLDAWRVTPFVFLLVYAALEQLPQAYAEAARLDGASRWNVMRRVQLPLILPALGVALALRSIDAFRIFAAPLVLAGVEGLPVLSTVAYHYQSDLNDQAGANVIALMLTIFLLVSAVVTLWAVNRRRRMA
jgi:multiple sugar transport system permease protein